MGRRLPTTFALAAGLVLSFAAGPVADSRAAGPEASARGARQGAAVTVYKTPRCGCCRLWVDHLRENGFEVRSVDLADLRETKARVGVPPQLAACHTALVDGYVIEGHVPASAVQRLLRERPDAVGLAVPGMPEGSPGMEGPDPEPYDVLRFDASGRVEVYESHVPPRAGRSDARATPQESQEPR